MASHAVAINPTTDFLTIKIVDAKNWVAAKMLIETLVLRCLSQRIDKDGHKVGRCRDDFLVNKRTACEIPAALSSGVLAKVQPDRPIRFLCNHHGLVVIPIPIDLADANRFVAGIADDFAIRLFL